MISEKDTSPLVSIGMPVYNGEVFLTRALDSLLSQTYQNFELIISDNASTDDTEDICKNYQRIDNRVLYYRNSKNMGFGWNQNQVIRLAKGKYFMLAHHDDIRSKFYIQKGVEILEKDPSIVLCYSITQDIDEEEKNISRPDPLKYFNSGNMIKRFREIIRLDHICEPDFGLIRMDILKKTVLHGNYPDSDRVLLAELILYGPFYKIAETLFFRRSHEAQSTEAFSSRQTRYVFFDPTKVDKIVFPYFREAGEYIKAINRVKMKLGMRLRSYREVVRWSWIYHRQLISDIIIAIKDLLRNNFTLKIKRYIFQMIDTLRTSKSSLF